MFEWMVRSESKAQASCADVWEIWTDVSSWPKWDRELEWSALHGPFIEGTMGELKPRGWPACQFRLTAAEKDRGYSDETKMPMTKVIFSHTVVPLEDSTVLIQHRVRVRGLLAPLLFFTLRRKLLKGLPKALATLARLAEAKAQK